MSSVTGSLKYDIIETFAKPPNTTQFRRISTIDATLDKSSVTVEHHTSGKYTPDGTNTLALWSSPSDFDIMILEVSSPIGLTIVVPNPPEIRFTVRDYLFLSSAGFADGAPTSVLLDSRASNNTNGGAIVTGSELTYFAAFLSTS